MTALSLLMYAASMLIAWIAALALQQPLLFAAGFLCATSIYVYKHAGAWNPRGGFGYANSVTVLRLLLCAGLAAVWTWADERAFGWRPVLVALFALLVLALDGVDGWLARRRGEAGDFGARLDAETDAAFLALLCLLLIADSRAPWFVGVIGAMRYCFEFVRAASGWPALSIRLRGGRQVFALNAFVLIAAFVLPLSLNCYTVSIALAALLASFGTEAWHLVRARRASQEAALAPGNSTAGESPWPRRALRLVLLLSVSLGGLWFAGSRALSYGPTDIADIAEPDELLLRIGAVEFGAAVLLALIAILCFAQRWRIFARVRSSPAEFMRASLQAGFVAQFAPVSLAADAARVLHFRGRQRRAVLRGLLLDKLANLLTLSVLAGGGCLLLVLPLAPAVKSAVPVTARMIGGAVGLATFLCATVLAIGYATARCVPEWLRGRITGWLYVSPGQLFGRASLPGWLYGLAGNLALGLSFGACALAFPLSDAVNWLQLGLRLPLLWLVLSLPISVAGWGLREVSALSLLAPVVFSPVDALGVSVLFGLAGLIASLPGAYYFARRWWSGDPASSPSIARPQSQFS